jgi:hypothetical protein
MDMLVQNALQKTFVQQDDYQGPSERFKIQSNSGTTKTNVDYFKLAEEEFGLSVKKKQE